MRLMAHVSLAIACCITVHAQSGIIVVGLNSTMDIGPQINNAILALPNGCGEVTIPAGNYVQSTTIIKPRCVKIHGEGAFGTVLNWQPSGGVALVSEDTSGQFNYPEGDVADISFNGPGASSTTIGTFLGGVPSGTSIQIYAGGTSCSSSNPPAGCPLASISASAYSDHQNFNRVRILNFGTAMQWGNNTWSVAISESLISSNGVGLYFPSGLSNSGESISIFGSRIQNNVTGLNLVGFSDFYFYGGSCDYNTSCGNVNAGHFYGVHFEQKVGPILTITGTSQPHVEIMGGWAQLACNSTAESCGADPYMFFVNSSLNPLFKLEGTFLLANHPVDTVVHWNGSGGAAQLIIADLPYHVGNPSALVDTSCNFWGCRIQDGTGNGAINNSTWSVHLDGTATFNSIMTTQNGAGASVGNIGGFANVQGNGTGLRLDPTNCSSSTPIYLINGVINATGNRVIADSYSPNVGTVAPAGHCEQPGTLVITGDGHGTFCRATDSNWTTLY